MTTGTGLIDLFVIGGGVNGAGIARDAAGRGLSVVLCEKDDLAEGTSSRSGKLVHGGLRYLEYYEFRLVREALIEREILLKAAPHIIWPLRFVLPHNPEDRPAWLVRLGLLLYDHLGGRSQLPGTRTLDLRRDPEGIPLLDQFIYGFEYSDCWVDDARLVVLSAVDAAERGDEVADIHVVRPVVLREGKMGCRRIDREGRRVGVDAAELAFPGMAMAIHQPRNDDGIGRIDFLRTGNFKIGTDRGDLAAFDQQIAFGDIADRGVHADDGASPQDDTVLLVHRRQSGKTAHILCLRFASQAACCRGSCCHGGACHQRVPA